MSEEYGYITFDEYKNRRAQGHTVDKSVLLYPLPQTDLGIGSDIGCDTLHEDHSDEDDDEQEDM